MAVERYDAIVIGTGQGGGPLAGALAEAGRKTAIIESGAVGGTCINYGCTPTKTMVASARVAYLARRAVDYGVNTGPVAIDLAVVRQRKRDIVERFSAESRAALEGHEHLELIFGQATFTGVREIEVRLSGGGIRHLGANIVVINTGAQPSPPAPEIRAPTLDSTSIMELGQVPKHLLIIGGGYVGLEFGQMFRRFGSAVTVVQRGAQLLGREDPDVADAVADILREDGIDLFLEARVAGAETESDDMIRMHVSTPDGDRTLTGSHLLVATGRLPATERLNLQAAGVATDARGYVVVDDRLETNVPGIYGIGDVKPGPAFTHISYDDFRILRDNLLRGGHRTRSGQLVPYTVFIDPQLGRIGMSETEARSRNLAVRVATMPMSEVARARETDEPRGFMKAVVEHGSGLILGATALGIEGGETMATLEVAMMGRLPYTVLRDAVFAHPTLAESLNNLFGRLD